MPGLRIATASGNWSSTSTWEGGLLPIAGDIVCSNNFTVTINQTANVDSITNTAQPNTGATATMTSQNTPAGYIVSASSFNGPGWDAFQAFNKGSGDWLSAGTGVPQWLSYEFPLSVIVDRYYFVGSGAALSRVPRDWTFEGWNGTSWVVLHTVTNAALGLGGTYASPILGNTTAYIRYRINVTATQSVGTNVGISEMYLFEKDYTTLTATAGGGFVLSDGYTLTCTNSTKGFNGINTAGLNLLTYSGSVSASINANFLYQNNTTARDILFNSTGTLNIVGNVKTNAFAFQSCISKTGTGTLNIIGNLEMIAGYANALTSTGGTVNITGDCTITQCNGNNGILITLSTTTANLTGNLYLYNCSDRSVVYVVSIGSNSFVTITGTLLAQDPITQTGVNNAVISNGSYCRVIGPMICLYNRNIAYTSTSTSTINILSGPFVCGPYGLFPINVSRMHLIPTFNNYVEFRDDSTNGALLPNASAPATRLVSPDTIIDAPTANNVRLGVSYGNGAYTGTCVIPSASNVALNVPFDISSVGTAYISASDITDQVWGSLVSNLNTPNSIGEKLKNASTVATTGAQIAALS